MYIVSCRHPMHVVGDIKYEDAESYIIIECILYLVDIRCTWLRDIKYEDAESYIIIEYILYLVDIRCRDKSYVSEESAPISLILILTQIRRKKNNFNREVMMKRLYPKPLNPYGNSEEMIF